LSKVNPFQEFLKRYGNDWPKLVKEMIGVTPDEWQIEVLKDAQTGVRGISIASCHGPGKSAVLSWICVCFLLTRFPGKIVQTAPSSPQLFDALFAETRGWINNLPPFLKELLVVTSDRIALKAAPDELFLSARTSRAESPEAMQGVHSPNVLLLADEASGIPQEVFNAARGSMSGESATTVLTGNPTRASGFFFDTHHELKQYWKTYWIYAARSPQAPKEEIKDGQHRRYGSLRVSQAFVDEIAASDGEDSNEYRIRVLGQFPTMDDNTVISRDLAEAAAYRDVVLDPQANEVWSVDVARFGDDRSVLLKRQGQVVTEIQSWKGLDLMQTCGRIKAEYDVASKKPSVICVDAIGVGGGVADRLLEQNLPIIAVNVSEAPAIGNYRNLRAELWFRVKDWLVKRVGKIPRDELLIAELCRVRYTYSSNGKIQVESKDEMKKRGLKSPDLADALCLSFASPEASYLGGGAYKWAKEIRRNLPGLV
jgi:phage terminase large subunit